MLKSMLLAFKLAWKDSSCYIVYFHAIVWQKQGYSPDAASQQIHFSLQIQKRAFWLFLCLLLTACKGKQVLQADKGPILDISALGDPRPSQPPEAKKRRRESEDREEEAKLKKSKKEKKAKRSKSEKVTTSWLKWASRVIMSNGASGIVSLPQEELSWAIVQVALSACLKKSQRLKALSGVYFCDMVIGCRQCWAASETTCHFLHW